MKKQSIKTRLSLKKMTITTLNGKSQEEVKGGAATGLACYPTLRCASWKNPCITQTESPTCRCV